MDVESQQTLSKKRRSSGILKKSPHRKSLAELDANLEPTLVEDDTRRGLRRRVSFANTNQVKEICRIADITEVWSDSNSTVDTSNLDIKKLAVIKKNKSEVAAESLNALMSAPILQNDEFSPSDLALLDETSGCSSMHLSDHTSILYTPEASLRSISTFGAEEDEVFGSAVEIGKEESKISKDEVVTPSFLKDYSVNEVQSNEMDVTGVKHPRMSDFGLSSAARKHPVTTSTPMSQPFAAMAEEKNCELNDMEETACLKRVMVSHGNVKESNLDNSSALAAEKFLGDDMEQTACIKRFPVNEEIQNQNMSVLEKLKSKTPTVESDAKPALVAKSNLAAADHTAVFDDDEMEMTECDIAAKIKIYTLTANKENLTASDDLKLHKQDHGAKQEADFSFTQSSSVSVQAGHHYSSVNKFNQSYNIKPFAERVTEKISNHANLLMPVRTTSFSEDLEITRCVPKHTATLAKHATLDEDLEITQCVPQSVSAFEKHATFSEDLEITRCVPKNTSALEKHASEDLEITRCVPKDTASLKKHATFNEDLEFTQCVPKNTATLQKHATFCEDLEITRCVPTSTLEKHTTFSEDLEFTQCLQKPTVLEVFENLNSDSLNASKAVCNDDMETTQCLKPDPPFQASTTTSDSDETPAIDVSQFFNKTVDFTSCVPLKAKVTGTNFFEKSNGQSSQVSSVSHSDIIPPKPSTEKERPSCSSITVPPSTPATSQCSKSMLETVKSFSAYKGSLLKTGKSSFVPTGTLNVGIGHAPQSVSITANALSESKNAILFDNDAQMANVSGLKPEERLAVSQPTTENRKSVSESSKTVDDYENSPDNSRVIFKLGTPDISGISNLDGEKSINNDYLSQKSENLGMGNASSVTQLLSNAMGITQPDISVQHSTSLSDVKTFTTTMPSQKSSTGLKSPAENEKSLNDSFEKIAIQRSPPLKRALEELTSVTNEAVTANDDVDAVSAKRVCVAFDETGPAVTAANVTNNMLDQDSSEPISMEEFLEMYVNVRIGGPRQVNRGRRSLVYPLRPSEKPTNVTDMLKTIYDLEYQLPIYQQFQQSIRDQLQRAEGEITELEEKFKASNPQIVQRIRFGNKDESERLLEKVDERAKQCKQLAKLHWKEAKNKLRKSLNKSWEVFETNEIKPITEAMQQFGDVNKFLDNLKQQIEADRHLYEEKLADLKQQGPLATEEQIQMYQSNKEKIHSLQQELSDKNKEKEEFTASKKKFDDTMAKVWRVFDQIKEEKTEQKRKADLRKARKKEWQALKRYILWEVIEDTDSFKSFNFLDDSLVFSVNYSDEQKITQFKLGPCIGDIDRWEQFLHGLILGDGEIISLLRGTDPSVDLAKGLNIVSRKVSSAITLGKFIRRMCLDVLHCAVEVDDGHTLLVHFCNRKPHLCRFKIRFTFYDKEKDETSFAPVTYQYVHDPSSFGVFGEQEVLSVLKEIHSPVYRLFKDYCIALFRLIGSPSCDSY